MEVSRRILAVVAAAVVAAAATGAVVACSPSGERAGNRAGNRVATTPSQSTPPSTLPPSTLPPSTLPTSTLPTSDSFSFLSAITKAAIPPDVSVACDTVATVVARATGLTYARANGTFDDFERGQRRTGCRLQAHGVPSAADSVELTEVIARALAPHRWAMDYRYMADGPNGSDIGLRRLTVLCEVIVTGPGDDDDADTTAAAKTPPDPSITVVLECVHDIANNADAGVPDSLWRIAMRAGIDSLYAIDVRLQYPPYLDGDFDGDGVADAAVLVQERSTGKLGIAFVLGGPKRVVIAGAGTTVPGASDDFSGIDNWDDIVRGVNYDVLHRPLPSRPGDGDAVRMSRGGTQTFFLIWRAGKLIAERAGS